VFSFLNFRADTYLLQAILLSSAYPLGLYSLATRMAEVVLYVPDSLATVFLPKVAGSSAEDAETMLGRVSRLSILSTILFALLLIPAAFALVYLVLPAYSPCLVAFLVLLPGAVSLSLAKVMASYLAGRGRPGLVSFSTMLALILNVACNLVLIPAYGIAGAATASLISYTAHGITMLLIACRLSGQSPVALCLPRLDEVRVLVNRGARLARYVGGAH
jgi:O-antigen/teichoic acid export membrane protein